MDEDDVILDECPVCGVFTNEWIAAEYCERDDCPHFSTGHELTAELGED